MIKHYYYCFNCSCEYLVDDKGKHSSYLCPKCHLEMVYYISQEIDEQTGNIINEFADKDRQNSTQHVSDEWKDRVYARAEAQNTPKCPTCQSTNIHKIGELERGASIFVFGLFSKKINKSFKCNSCGYTW